MAMGSQSYFSPTTPNIVMKSLFMKYDTDNNGSLSTDELLVMFQDDLGMNAEEAGTYILLLDDDGSGNVSYEEFSNWLRSGEQFQTVNDNSRYKRVKKAVDLFNQFDTDGNQALDRAEFKTLYIAVGGKAKNADLALQKLDSDGNGKISFPEFLKWLNYVKMDSFKS